MESDKETSYSALNDTETSPSTIPDISLVSIVSDLDSNSSSDNSDHFSDSITVVTPATLTEEDKSSESLTMAPFSFTKEKVVVAIVYVIFYFTVWTILSYFLLLFKFETDLQGVVNDGVLCKNRHLPHSSLLIVSDVHVDPIMVTFDLSTRALLQDEQADGCVVLGDMITWGGGKDGRNPSFSTWTSYVDRFFWTMAPIYERMPTATVPGNHDVKNGNLPERYIARFGKSNVVKQIGNFSVFLHNSLNPCNTSDNVNNHDWGPFQENDCRITNPKEPVDIIATHYHLRTLQQPIVAKVLLENMRPYAIFSGHEHAFDERFEMNYVDGNGIKTLVPEIGIGTALYARAEGNDPRAGYARLIKYEDGCMEYSTIRTTLTRSNLFRVQISLSFIIPLVVLTVLCLYIRNLNRTPGRTRRISTHEFYEGENLIGMESDKDL